VQQEPIEKLEERASQPGTILTKEEGVRLMEYWNDESQH
jgi:hypothetical protein